LAAALLFPSAARLEARDVEVVCVGDVMMAHGMKPVLEREGADFPFRRLEPLFRRADVLFGNLETPIAARGSRYPDKEFHFLMDPPHAEALKRAGFDVMSAANNHVLDFGPEALESTLATLNGLGIAVCGAGPDAAAARAPAVVDVRGERVAFLAYSLTFPVSFAAAPDAWGTAYADERFVREDVARAKAAHDWVVVSFHWGEEYSTSATGAQRKLARAAIDAGADAVVGHHPHVVQGLELHEGRPVAYSLGNLVFGTRNPAAREGLVLRLRFRPGQPVRAEAIPVLVDNTVVSFQPRPLKGRALAAALRRLRRQSAELGTKLRLKKDRAVLP
jgi:poly-gamma-glutamate synthesis protein (capsule biosynthesis protein)